MHAYQSLKDKLKRTYIASVAVCVSCGGSVTILAVYAATVLCCVLVCFCQPVSVCVSAQGQTTGIAVAMLT